MFRRLVITFSAYAAIPALLFSGVDCAQAGVSDIARPAGNHSQILIAQASAPAPDPDIDEPVLDDTGEEVATPTQPAATPPKGPVAPGNVPPQPGRPSPGALKPGVPAAPAPTVPPAVPGRPPQPQGTPSPAALPSQIRVAPSFGGSSFFFDDADVFEVVQTVLGEVLKVNYIIDPQVKGRVNFRTSTPIPRDKILPIMEIILRLNGVAIVEESGLYRVIPIGGIAKEPAPIRFGKDPNAIELKGTALLQIVPLTFINSSEMTGILTPLLTQGGAIYDVTKKNILIIADTDANVRRLLQVIAMFDVDSYKDAAQAKIYVYPLQNSKAEHVAKILQQVLLGQAASSTTSSSQGVKTSTGQQAVPTAQRPTAGPTAPVQTAFTPSGANEPLVSANTKIIADDVANSLVIFASPSDYSIVLGAIKQIDTTPRQVMIEAVVARIDLTDNLTFGLRWNFDAKIKLKDILPFGNGGVNIGGPLGFTNLPNFTSTSTFGYSAVDSGNAVRLAIEALAENDKAKILSAPHILVADNREAKIQVGQQIPIATSTTSTPLSATTIDTTTTAVTNTTTSTIQYKDVGTILKVKPQVNDSGLVALEITQEVSDFTVTNILGTQQFVINKSEVTSNLIAQDGNTIIIGGLVNESTKFARGGIPFLSKIPVLGYLFGNTTDNTLRTEIVILLTPRVIRNQVEAQKMTSDYYELFKNVDKEINLDKHKKTWPHPNQGDQAPAQNNGNAGTPASGKNSDNKLGAKPAKKPYPLSSNDN